MPRKFLGEKIEKHIDVMRPASMTLTVDDLDMIPSIPTSSSEESLPLQDGEVLTEKKTKRLSRKFGGTVYFKKRLGSVPEIFLRDFKNRKVKETPTNESKRITSMNVLPNIIEKRSEVHRNISKRRVLQRGQREVSHNIESQTKVFHRPKPPVIKLSENSEIEQRENLIFVPTPPEPNVRTAQFGNKLGHMKMNSKSTNELLFDEILEAYCDGNDVSSIQPFIKDNIGYQNETHVLSSEIERVLEHVRKQQNIVEMNKKIDIMDEITEIDSISSSPSHTKHLSEILSANDNSTSSGSEIWSDDDLSIQENTSMKASEEGYETARETMPSSLEIASLDIPNEADHKDLILRNNNLIIMKLKKIVIQPTIFDFDYPCDIEPINLNSTVSTDTIQMLQDKIDKISLEIDSIDIRSINSSIYS